jgi:zinc protease
VPAIDVTLAVRGGAASDPLDKSGLAQFTAGMLRKGTEKRTSDQISQAIDSVGGVLDAEAEDDGTVVGCRARSRDFRLCLDLVSDVVQHASFPEAEMGEIRDQLNATVEGARDNPAALAGEHAANLYFGDDDTRGLPISKKSLQAIDRKAIVDFHKSFYAPNNSVLAVSGDFDPKTLKKELTKWFGDWKKDTVPNVTDRPLPPDGAMKVRLVDKPDATQSQIVIVGPGIKHADPDLFATRLMNYTLGGGQFSSRLMRVVRSEGGKTYGARSAFDARRQAGNFTATTFTRNSETTNTLKLVLDEIKRMHDGGPTIEELAAAKANLIGGYGLRFETATDTAHQLLVAELDGLEPDFSVRYPERLNAVKVSEAAEAGQKHLRPQALVVVGKAQEIKPMLVAAKLPPTEVVSYTDPVSGTERRAAQAAKEAVKKEAATATPAEETAGKKLLETALKAKGGDALAKVKDLKMSGSGVLSVQGQNLQLSFESFYVPNKAVREDLSLGPGTVSQVYADGQGFVKEAGRVVDLPAGAAQSMKSGLFRDVNFILLNAMQPGARVRANPPVTEGKTKYESLTVVAPDGEPTQVLLDPLTHQIARLLYSEEGKPVREDFDKYKPEGGISFAHHAIHEGEGQRLELEYDKIQVNKGLPKDAFAR